MKIFREVEQFLIKYCGTSEKVLDGLFDHTSKQNIHSLFFKPYSSKMDFFKRSISIVSAPLIFSFLSVEIALSCIIYAGNAVLKLILLDPPGARGQIAKAAKALSGVFITLVAAVVSPVINLVDFIGGLVTTLMGLNQDCEQADGFFPQRVL